MHNMRSIITKTILLWSLLVCVSVVNAQYVTIADRGFGAWLVANGYSSCITGAGTTTMQLDTTCATVLNATSIVIQGDTNIHAIGEVKYFKNLEELRVSTYTVTLLPDPLPSTLLHLDISSSGILNLPVDLPSGLLDLQLDGTGVSFIPPLPSSLMRLWCGYGAPKVITSLPPSLGDFECSNCGLSTLPALPSTLVYLDLSYNQLTTLPLLPDTMSSAILDHNRFTQLANLPIYTSLDITISDNPSLTCLPSYSYINTLNFSNTGIACIPNSNITSSTPSISTLPLCSTSNPNGCSYVQLVYPGDANNDRHADNGDLLNIGLAYGATGPVRSGASLAWVGQAATDWTDSFSTGLNYKFSDCNGDGTIDANDTLAILQNFGLSHAKNDGSEQTWLSGAPSLTVKLTRDTITNGDTMTVNVILGDATTPANNIYGLAFTFNYDPAVTDTNTSSFRFANSWLYNSATTITLSKDLKAFGRVKAAITGINHQNRSGNGVIALYKATITTGNINGKDLSYYSNRIFISDITTIDASGAPIALNAGADSNKVSYTPTGIREIGYTEQVAVYPNPTKDKVQVICAHAMQQIQLMDIAGKVVKTIEANEYKAINIDLAGIESGIYTMQVNTAQGRVLTKLSILK